MQDNITYVHWDDQVADGEEEIHIPTEATGLWIREGTTSVPEEIFSSQTDQFKLVSLHSCLQVVVLPRTLQEIQGYAFRECSGLETVRFDRGDNNKSPQLKLIGESAFEYCTSLLNVEWPASLESIEASAFIQCSSLPRLTLPLDQN